MAHDRDLFRVDLGQGDEPVEDPGQLPGPRGDGTGLVGREVAFHRPPEGGKRACGPAVGPVGKHVAVAGGRRPEAALNQRRHRPTVGLDTPRGFGGAVAGDATLRIVGQPRPAEVDGRILGLRLVAFEVEVEKHRRRVRPVRQIEEHVGRGGGLALAEPQPGLEPPGLHASGQVHVGPLDITDDGDGHGRQPSPVDELFEQGELVRPGSRLPRLGRRDGLPVRPGQDVGQREGGHGRFVFVGLGCRAGLHRKLPRSEHAGAQDEGHQPGRLPAASQCRFPR